MKKILITIFALALTLSLASCSTTENINGGSSDSNQSGTSDSAGSIDPSVTTDDTQSNSSSEATNINPTDTESSKEQAADADSTSSGAGKSLVVYYSQSGNTKALANVIKQSTNSDIFELLLTDPYPDNYNQTTERVGREQREHINPELSKKLENIGDYDTVFIGSPIWRSTLAPPISSFIADYDLSGKTVIPFFTSDSGTMGNAVSVIKGLVPGNVTMLDALAVRGGDANNSQGTVNDWIRKIGITK